MKEQTNKVNCTCPNKNCPRHGDCKACRKKHERLGKPPACSEESTLKK